MKNDSFFVFTDDFFALLSQDEWPLVVCSYANRQALAAPHVHAFNELVFIISGTGSYLDAEGNTLRLKPGNVFFLKPGMRHGYIEQQQLAVTNILWYEHELQMPLYDLKESPGYHAMFELEPQNRGRHRLRGALELTGTQLTEVSTLLQHMQFEQQRRQPGSRLMLVSMFGQLLTRLCRYYCDADSNEMQELLQMDRAIAFIQKNYRNAISRSQLAQLASMSETTFYRKFLQMLGCTPSEYIQTIRFLAVEKMLRSTDANLATIALRCGFTDGNYLSNTFKKRYGETPRHFRLRQQATRNASATTDN